MPYIKQKDGHLYEFHKIIEVHLVGDMLMFMGQSGPKKAFRDVIMPFRTVSESDVPEVEELLKQCQ